MSLDEFELQSLADAAGYGAVFDEDIDLARSEPIEHEQRFVARHRTDWRFPDAPAPRSSAVSSRSPVVQQPLWLSQSAPQPAPSAWSRHLQSASRGVTALFAGRGVPA